jgi:hypothetical protein
MAYQYDKRDESVYDEGHAAYERIGMQAINPYDPTKFPIKHGAWQLGRDNAHREAFEKRQQQFINKHA